MVLSREQALLDAIYASPDDDAPRQVFADALTERGDPRGEFITLQLARARGEATPAQFMRERDLFADPSRHNEWGYPLGESGRCVFARGFPETLLPRRGRRDELLHQPAMRLLRGIDFLFAELPVALAKAILLQPSAARLESVAGLSQDLLESLDAPLKWPLLAIRFDPTSEHRAHLIHARALEIYPGMEPLRVDSLLGLQRLERLTFVDAEPGALRHLTGLIELTSSSMHPSLHWSTELSELPHLKCLDIQGEPVVGTEFDGLKIEKLLCIASGNLDVDRLLGSLPRLGELELGCTSHAVERSTIAKVLAATRLSQLRSVTINTFRIINPTREDATLEVAIPRRAQLGELAKVLELFPANALARILARPFGRSDHPPPSLEPLRAVAKVPIELAWY